MSIRLHGLTAALALCGAASALSPWVGTAAAAGPEAGLDQRGWEMVSPANKNGGAIEMPGAPGAGVLQAAAGGGEVAFGSAASFGAAAGAAPVSQYLAARGSSSWSTQNLTPPLFTGTYAGGAYQLFSPALDRALLGSGWRCRDGGISCAAENPPLGPAGPAGYRNLYLREAGGYTPLITTANAAALSIPAAQFELALAGAAADLRHAVISSCAALTGDAAEVAAGAGCDPAAPNLYEWSSDGTLAALNLLPGEEETAPGASLGASIGAVSSDGARVYWQGADGNLYLRAGGETIQVDAGAGGGGEFQVASENGAVAYFIAAGHLYRYRVAGAETSDLTPAGEAQGVLGISSDGSSVYYLTASGLYLYKGTGAAVKVAAQADASNLPAATGSARVTPDGSRLVFLSSASLTGYPNLGKSEVFLYEAAADRLRCVSCNPRGTSPVGASSIPGALAAGDGPAAYKPRALSSNGTRVFFDSADALVTQDSDGVPDVYEWEATGAGTCAKANGCVALISGGRTGSAYFLDASSDGSDAYFLTDSSLLPADTGSIDIYDARPGGGFPEPEPQIPCNGDACQGPAPAPEDTLPNTSILIGPANPPLNFKQQKQKKKAHKKKHGHKKKNGQKRKHGKGAKR